MAAKRAPPGQQAERGDQEFTFTNVQLLKNETLGTGSYGAVCKAKCDQLTCAAKLIWPALLQLQAPDPGKEHRQPFHRFESECHLVSRINHPNIVQYLGTYHDSETNAPVLLMELMDESLTHFLESSTEDIPYHLQVNLASDIAQALAFLHANGIIHRDLSSNNVLLLAGSRAKVTDFGMLKFTHIGLSASRLATMTTCPGTPAFMPPEALNEPPVYTEKLDNFSFGVLLVQIVTRQFPTPSDRFEMRVLIDPHSNQSIQAQVAIPEIERRQTHISLIEPTHPLLPMALDCLKDRDLERPSSQQLCQSLDALKKTARYEESSQQDTQQLLRAKDELIRASQVDIRARDEQIENNREQMRAKDEELDVKREENDQLTCENLILRNEKAKVHHDIQAIRRETEALDRQLKRFDQQLESKEKLTATLQQTIAQQDRELRKLRKMLTTSKNEGSQDLSSRLHSVEEQATLTAERSTKIVWERLPDAPTDIRAGSSTGIGDKAYFTPQISRTIHEFDSSNNQWALLSPYPIPTFTIVSVENMLTTVGGCSNSLVSGSEYSNKLHSYVCRKWVEHFPPMPTRRCTPGAVCANNMLIVAGGDNGTSLTTVEILNTDNKQWSSVSELPFPSSQPSTTICGSDIYLHTCFGSSEQEGHSVLKCSLLALAHSKPSSTVWKRIAPLPVRFSSLASINAHLLAVGGEDSTDIDTADILQYNPTTNSWQVVSQMTFARYKCLTVSLPEHKLMVVGNGIYNYRKVEIATITFE